MLFCLKDETKSHSFDPVWWFLPQLQQMEAPVNHTRLKGGKSTAALAQTRRPAVETRKREQHEGPRSQQQRWVSAEEACGVDVGGQQLLICALVLRLPAGSQSNKESQKSIPVISHQQKRSALPDRKGLTLACCSGQRGLGAAVPRRSQTRPTDTFGLILHINTFTHSSTFDCSFLPEHSHKQQKAL